VLAHDRVDGRLRVAVRRERVVGHLRGGVEEPLAVDAEVEDVLDQPGRLVAEHALVLGAGLGLLERAADVLDRLARAAPTDAEQCHVVLLEPCRRPVRSPPRLVILPRDGRVTTGRDQR
jgi:hypothetical protein